MKNNKTLEFIKEYWILLLVIFIPVWWFAAMIVWNIWKSWTMKQVHWHMPISYELCGNTTQLKDSGEHGKLHWHDDNKVHIEWIVNTEKRDETLGGFFDSANIAFSENQIGKYKSWDICPWSGTAWKVSVEINGKQNTEFREYILNDWDKIKIIFK